MLLKNSINKYSKDYIYPYYCMFKMFYGFTNGYIYLKITDRGFFVL